MVETADDSQSQRIGEKTDLRVITLKAMANQEAG